MGFYQNLFSIFENGLILHLRSFPGKILNNIFFFILDGGFSQLKILPKKSYE